MKPGALAIPNADARAAVVRAAYAYGYPWDGLPSVETAIEITRKPSYDYYRYATLRPRTKGVLFLSSYDPEAHALVNSVDHLIARHRHTF